ncbi:hypothetical protein RYX36_012126, partial [Vicia faba]
RNVWSERFVRIDDGGSYKDYWTLLENYKWEVLFETFPKLHLEIVHEFYLNALPLEGSPFDFKTWATESHFVYSYGSRRFFSLHANETTLDIARVITNEMKRLTFSNTRLRDRISCQLTYPGLIMGL